MEVFVRKGSVTGKSLFSTTDNRSVLGMPSTSSGNEIFLDKCSAKKGCSKGVLRNRLASTSEGRTVETHFTSKDDKTCLEQHVDSKCTASVPGSLSVSGNFVETFMRCENNHEDNTFHLEITSVEEQSAELNKTEDVNVVDIMECVNSSESGLSEAFDSDTSDSSFGDTVSDHENGTNFTHFEVNSALAIKNASAFAFSGRVNDLPLRKKKVTDHWRNFIHPIEWRCRWVEVQRKKLHFQVLNYERELTQFNHRKQFELGKRTSVEVGAKALPFCNQLQRKNVMKRKKRERIEDTTDVKSYISEHNLFSYFENSKALTDSTCKDNDPSKPVIPADQTKVAKDEFGVDDEGSALQFEYDDDSFERILWRIDSIQSQLQKLKTRGDNLMTEIPKECSSMNTLSLLAPCNALISAPVGASCKHSAAKSDTGPNTNVSNKIMSMRVTASKTNVSNSKGTTELFIASKTNFSTSKRTSGRRKPCPSNWSKRL